MKTSAGVPARAPAVERCRGTGPALVVWCDVGQSLRALASDAWAWLRRILSVRPLAAPAAVMPDTLTALGAR